MAKRIEVTWHEDGNATALARITARNGSGSATGVDGEGNWLQQADLTSIACKVFEKGAGQVSLVAEPTVTISSAVLDTPVTTNVLWTQDTTGYNFVHDLAATNFRTGTFEYIVEYTFTVTGGDKLPPLVFEGCADSVLSS